MHKGCVGQEREREREKRLEKKVEKKRGGEIRGGKGSWSYCCFMMNVS